MHKTIVDLLNEAVLRSVTDTSFRPKAILMSIFVYGRLLEETGSANKPIRIGNEMHEEAKNLRFMNLPIYRSIDVAPDFYMVLG